jgi:hypothetical protein
MTHLPIEKDFTSHGETKDFSDSGVWLREGKGFTAPLSPGPWTGLYSMFCGILEMFEIRFIHENEESGMGTTKQQYIYKKDTNLRWMLVHLIYMNNGDENNKNYYQYSQK